AARRPIQGNGGNCPRDPKEGRCTSFSPQERWVSDREKHRSGGVCFLLPLCPRWGAGGGVNPARVLGGGGGGGGGGGRGASAGRRHQDPADRALHSRHPP